MRHFPKYRGAMHCGGTDESSPWETDSRLANVSLFLPSLSSSFFFLFFFPTFSIFKEYVSTVFVKMTQNYYKKL